MESLAFDNRAFWRNFLHELKFKNVSARMGSEAAKELVRVENVISSNPIISSTTV